MFSKKKVELGDCVRDKITGFTGIVIAITEWLHACRRITIQPKELKNGKPVDTVTFDEPQVEVVVKQGYGKPVEEKAKTGGPAISPVRANNPV